MLLQSWKNFQRAFRERPIRGFANMVFELLCEAQTPGHWIVTDGFIELVRPVYDWRCGDLVFWRQPFFVERGH